MHRIEERLICYTDGLAGSRARDRLRRRALARAGILALEDRRELISSLVFVATAPALSSFLFDHKGRSFFPSRGNVAGFLGTRR